MKSFRFFKTTLLTAQFTCEWLIDFPYTVFIRIIPQSVVTVAIIRPPRMIDYRILANPLDRHIFFTGSMSLITNVAQPAGTKIIFNAGFSNEQGAPVALVNLAQDRSKRAIQRVRNRNHRPIRINPLVMRIIIYAYDIEIFFVTAKFRHAMSPYHIP